MTDLGLAIAALASLATPELRRRWQQLYRVEPPARLSRDLLIRGVAYQLQERALGGLTPSTKRKLRTFGRKLKTGSQATLAPGLSLKPGSKLVREWRSRSHTVTVLEDGFGYAGQRYRSLTKIARAITGAHWSGPRFFGLNTAKPTINGTESVA